MSGVLNGIGDRDMADRCNGQVNKPLVSVVLPVYNGELYLREAVDSILAQTYKDFELIAIDDGSTDKTLGILREYEMKDSRVVIITRENKGLVASLNEGIEKAQGKYIARMDADDAALPERFAKQVEYMEEHDDVYILGTDYELMYEDGCSEEVRKAAAGTNKRSRALIDDSDWFLSTNETMKFIHPTIRIRKELFHEIGLYRQFMLEDLELYFRAGSRGYRIAKLPEILLNYRVRATSKSRTEKRAQQTKELMEMKLEYLTEFVVEASDCLEEVMSNETILDKQSSCRYLIWGADISGDLGKGIVEKYLPKWKFLGYIDSFKEGDLNNYPIIKPEQILGMEPDYIFICTNGGAVFARGKLKELGYEEVREFFKIS